MHVSDRIYSVARWARRAAILDLVFFMILLAIAVVLLNREGTDPAEKQTAVLIFLTGLAIYIVPAAALWATASWLERGSPWAFFTLLPIILFEIVKAFLGRIAFFHPCLLIFQIPAMGLAAQWLNAFRDVYDEIRKRAPTPRGFDVVPTGSKSRPMVLPPRPKLGTSVRKPTPVREDVRGPGESA